MDRKEFFATLGISSVAFTLATCVQGCAKAQTTKTAPVVDFTLDLSSISNNALNSNGGYLYYGGVIVARTSTGLYVAVSQACTHQGVSVVYQGNGGQFLCPAHGSSFSPTGAVNTGPAIIGLKSYNTLLSGTKLRVWG
jgi:cytochrome b6-f complex iron-sulfur subunit